MEKSVMTKKVNVTAPIPVRTVNPPIFGKLEGVYMTPANILKCLIGRATVHEVLSDGSLLKLNDRNYNKVNTPAVKYPEHKELAKQKSAVNSNSFTRSKPPKNNQKEAMNKDLQDFVDSKFIPQSTGPKTFSAPEVDGDETKTYKEVIAETTPDYLKGVEEEAGKEIISDEQVEAAQAAAKELMEAPVAEEQPTEEPEGTPEDHEAIKAMKDLIREECSKIVYDFNEDPAALEERVKKEAKRLLMEVGDYDEAMADEVVASMDIKGLTEGDAIDKKEI